MIESRRRSPLREPLKGASYVIGLGLLVGLSGAAIAGLLVWFLG